MGPRTPFGRSCHVCRKVQTEDVAQPWTTGPAALLASKVPDMGSLRLARFGGDPNHRRIGGDVFGHHSAGTDHRTIAERDVLQNLRASPYKDAATHLYPAGDINVRVHHRSRTDAGFMSHGAGEIDHGEIVDLYIHGQDIVGAHQSPLAKRHRIAVVDDRRMDGTGKGAVGVTLGQRLAQLHAHRWISDAEVEFVGLMLIQPGKVARNLVVTRVKAIEVTDDVASEVGRL